MASFNSLSGGLVDTVVAGVGNNVSTAIQNIGSGQASFGINSILGGVVQSASGYALNEGQNYVLNQLGASLGNSEYSALTNAVVTQVATAGLNQAINFVSQAIPNPFLGGNNVTTAGLGAQAARSSISISDDVVSRLEDADYGGIAYTVQDITFTLTPAGSGAQSQSPPQTSPTLGWDLGFSSGALVSTPAIDAFKGSLAFDGAAKGVDVVSAYKSGIQLGPQTTGFNSTKIKPLF